VHEFGITFLVGNPSIPCGDSKTRTHHTSPPCAKSLCLPDNKFLESRLGFEPGPFGFLVNAVRSELAGPKIL